MPQSPPEIAEGARLFNAGRFFDAHEAWEDLWHQLAGRERQFVQVLIQLAVACEHAQRGNARGALRMLRRAEKRLHPVPPHCYGLDAADLLAQTAVWLLPLRHGRPLQPEGRPVIAHAGA